MTVPEIDKLRNPESTIEFEKALRYHNGFCCGKGICTSLTLNGRKSIYWKLGFWRAGGRKPNLRKNK